MIAVAMNIDIKYGKDGAQKINRLILVMAGLRVVSGAVLQMPLGMWA